MPAIAIPDTTRVVAKQVFGDESIVNVWHVVDAISGTPPVISELLEAFRVFYRNTSASAAGVKGIGHLIGQDVILAEISYQRLTSVPYPTPQVIEPGEAGTEGGQPLPPQTALCVSLRTGVASRRARGRIYLGGFSEGSNTGDISTPAHVVPSTLTDVSTALADLDDNVNAAGGQIGVLSEADVVCRPVTSVRLRDVWATQRRRMRQMVPSVTQTTSFLEA